MDFEPSKQFNRDARFRSCRTAVVEAANQWELDLADSLFPDLSFLDGVLNSIIEDAEPRMPELSDNLRRTLALEFMRAIAGRLIEQLDRKPATVFFDTLAEALQYYEDRPKPAAAVDVETADNPFVVYRIGRNSLEIVWIRTGGENA